MVAPSNREVQKRQIKKKKKISGYFPLQILSRNLLFLPFPCIAIRFHLPAKPFPFINEKLQTKAVRTEDGENAWFSNSQSLIFLTKTRNIFYPENFQFLGFHYKKGKDFPQISILQKSLSERPML